MGIDKYQELQTNESLYLEGTELFKNRIFEMTGTQHQGMVEVLTVKLWKKIISEKLILQFPIVSVRNDLRAMGQIMRTMNERKRLL